MQGVGAAIAAPSTLALLTTTFREGHERTRAIAYYSAVAGGGGSVGLVLGGMLTDWLSWRWGLFINVPVGLAVILARAALPARDRAPHGPLRPRRRRHLHARHDRARLRLRARRLRRLGAIAGTLASFAAGVALLAAFVLTETRAEQPITPLHLFADRERSGAYVARILVTGGMFSTFFFLTQFLQGVERLQRAPGRARVPADDGRDVRDGPRRADRSRRASATRRLLIGGLALAVVGIAWLSRVTEGTHYFPQHRRSRWRIVGVGIGIAFTPLTAAGHRGRRASATPARPRACSTSRSSSAARSASAS